MQVNGFLKDKASSFCCLTGKKFKEKRIYSKTHNSCVNPSSFVVGVYLLTPVVFLRPCPNALGCET